MYIYTSKKRSKALEVFASHSCRLPCSKRSGSQLLGFQKMPWAAVTQTANLLCVVHLTTTSATGPRYKDTQQRPAIAKRWLGRCAVPNHAQSTFSRLGGQETPCSPGSPCIWQDQAKIVFAKKETHYFGWHVRLQQNTFHQGISGVEPNTQEATECLGI